MFKVKRPLVRIAQVGARDCQRQLASLVGVHQTPDVRAARRFEMRSKTDQPCLPEMTDHDEAHQQARVRPFVNLDFDCTQARLEFQQCVLHLVTQIMNRCGWIPVHLGEIWQSVAGDVLDCPPHAC